jgi:chromosome segregation ATPase
MIEGRVSRPEAEFGEIRQELRETRRDMQEISRRVGSIEERLARMEGGFAAIHAKLDALPTVWTFTIGVIGTVCAVLAITLGLR